MIKIDYMELIQDLQEEVRELKEQLREIGENSSAKTYFEDMRKMLLEELKQCHLLETNVSKPSSHSSEVSPSMEGGHNKMK